MTDSFKVGCFLMILCAVGLLIILPFAALKYQNDNLQTRIEELEK